MNFDFDEQQYSFRDSLARFLADAYPLDRHADEADHWSELAELGLFALLVPEEHEGLGLSLVDLALGVEELGKVLAPLGVAETLVATDAIARFGTAGQKQALLPGISAGGHRVAIAVLEPGAGYDPRDLRTGFARGTLSGRKMLVPDAATADTLLVVARAENGRPGLFLVDRAAQGVGLTAENSLDPSAAYHELLLADAPAEPLGGAEGAVARLLDVAAAVYAGLLTGIAGRMLEISVDYARQRAQFGQAIGAFQAIKHKCADLATTMEGARSAAYFALWAAAEDAPERARAVSMAKAFCGDAARQSCQDGIQIHGGMGFTWELGLHHYLRRAKVMEYAYGDAAWHRERVVAETMIALGAAQAAPSARAAA